MFDNRLIPTGLARAVAAGGFAGAALAGSLACVWLFSAIGLLLSLAIIFGAPPLAFGISLAPAGALFVIVAIGLGLAVAASAAGEPAGPSDSPSLRQ
jgi:hypothetical protein